MRRDGVFPALFPDIDWVLGTGQTASEKELARHYGACMIDGGSGSRRGHSDKKDRSNSPGNRGERRSMVSDATRIAIDDLDQPDPDTDGAGRFLSDPPLSRKTIYRLAEKGEITGYLLSGKRLWKRASLRACKERCIAAGPQLQALAEPDQKRKPGRPKQTKTEPPAAAAE
jgi:hypothetical protein